MKRLIFLLMVISSAIYAKEINLEQWLQNCPEVVDQIVDSKIYFNHRNLELEDGQLVVQSKHSSLHLGGEVYSDDNGVYILAGSRVMKEKWICMGCSRVYHYCPTKCENDYCQSRDFICRWGS